MAKPRVFISSTFYDLLHVREDLERFVKELGYEPVRHETGAIAYGKDGPPEDYAYREVELCDIVVSVIGGRFGSQSQRDEDHSISQRELERALERGIQVFIFVEKNVLSEYGTYQLNKGSAGIKYKFVDDVRIYEFLDKLYALPKNNPIAPFGTAIEVVDYLRAQWAGLFQRFLAEQKRNAELAVLEEMKSVASTLQEVTKFLTVERQDRDDALKGILVASHPAFRRFAKLTGTSYRVYFTDSKELNAWLSSRGWKPVAKDAFDADSVAEWSNDKAMKYIKLTQRLFDNKNRLIVYADSDWDDQWLSLLDWPEALAGEPAAVETGLA